MSDATLRSEEPVHVLVDAHVFDPRGRGMSHYAAEYIEGLARARSEFRFTVMSRFPAELAAGPALRHVRIPNVPAPIWEQVLAPLHVRRERPQILHALANTLPVVRRAGTARVVTLHDVLFMHPDPEISAGETLPQRIGKIYRTTVCRQTIPTCDAVLTVSAFSKAEIEKRFPSQTGRVEVAHLGPSLTAPTSAPQAARAPYVLLPSGVHSRKNARRAIHAFLEFRRQTASPWRLLVFGIGPAQLERGELSGECDVTAWDAVQLLGYVPEADLPGLFQGAEAVFFPSLHEGFGIPVLDALSLGKPVITSKVSSLPEIGGDAALYVDPWSVDDMARGLATLYRDRALAHNLTERAARQASKFSWENLTAKTLSVYRALAGRRG
jgi:glycosyltransferase involved in cell wall biosynthesis